MTIDFQGSERKRPGGSDDAESPQVMDETGSPSVGAEARPRSRADDWGGRRGEAGDRAETRLSRWQRRLLDLSLHNRLLNFKPTRRSLELFCPEPVALAKKLQEGARIKIVPMPKAMEQDDPEAEVIDGESAAAVSCDRLAMEALRRNEVMVDFENTELATRLVELYRTARTDIQEGGANTLFLVLGFLKWRRDDKGNRIFQAPLILIPVSLQRRSVRSGVRMVLHEDEPRFNTTLVEMLRQDFGLEMNGLDESLLPDDGGLDVIGVWSRIRREIRDIAGFEVMEKVVLGTFSFAKYLMWKDLVDRTDQIITSRVVRQLTESPRRPFESDGEFPEPVRLDREFPPDALFTALPADSSQLSAIAACAMQKDFVLIGPPGTGKSQTIANMIAHTISNGRSVLFVSEKAAALDVVYRRLQEVGLGEFCLELHSNKARKVEVLAQLEAAWNADELLEEAEWHQQARRLNESRQSLNLYVYRIHRRYRNGLTPFLAMGHVISELGQPFVEFSWPSIDAHDDAAMARFRDIARKMDVYAAETGNVSDSVFSLVHHGEWSPAWQKQLVSAAVGIVTAVSDVRQAIAAFFGALRINQQILTLDRLRALKLLAAALPKAKGRALNFAFERGALGTISRLDDGIALLQRYQRLEKRLAGARDDRASARNEPGTPPSPWREGRASWWPQSEAVRRRIRNAMMAHGGVSGKSDFARELNLSWQLEETGRRIDELKSLADKVPGWRGLDTHVAPLEHDLHLARRLLYAIATLGTDATSLKKIHFAVRELVIRENEMLDGNAAVGQTCAAVNKSLQRLERVIEEFSAIADANAYECIQAGAEEDWLDVMKSAAEGIVAKEAQLNAWCSWRRIRDEAIRAGLGPLAAAVEHGEVSPGRILRCFEHSYCRWWVSEAVQQDSVLRTFHAADRNDSIREFRDLDETFAEITRQHIRARLCLGLLNRDETGKSSEFSILRRELEKKTRHKPLRQLIGEIPTALTRLTPCLLMSPLSVAQYLNPAHSAFDLVIFDEASQITIWDAIGAVARGKQTIVVGDPKQLPPTSFFSRSEEEADDGDVFDGDLESILDECLGAGLPARKLGWHYRSAHESLIAFSNYRYYGGNLITFPSPFTYDRAVRRNYVADGVYGRGGTRTNRAEAKAVVAEVIKRLNNPTLPDSSRSIGVVTFNVEQQRLIEDLLDEERLKDPSIERYFSDDQFEFLFVKNLESVQGDERDVILFSVTFGPDADGFISMNFGPLNRDGGERRLNVAITRARSEFLVFTSLGSEQIDLSRASGAGVKDFKQFLEFAERGSQALAESIYGSVGEFASPFESAVARSLSERGWVVHPQIGVSAFRISLGIVHPDSPGRYLAGVECDGATYRRSATARDRDKLREEVLRRIGWKIVRIWSMDWWIDQRRAADRLDESLTGLLEQARAEAEAKRMALLYESLRGSSANDSGPQSNTPQQNDIEAPSHGDFAGTPATRHGETGLERPSVPVEFKASDSYSVFDPSKIACSIDPEKFFDRSQDEAVQKMIEHIVAAEGPLRDDLLVKRVVRALGFKRTGRKLRDRVLSLATSLFETTTDAGGIFFWPRGISPHRWTTFRAPVSEDDFRSATEICFEELAALARETQAVGSEDPAREMALKMGLTRIDSGTRRRLEEVLARVAGQHPADESGG